MNPKKFFDEVYRVLKPNGFFLIQCSFMFDEDEYTENNIKDKNAIREIGKKFSKRIGFDESKLARLGKKLRENLQKRKLQARARGEQKNNLD